jgi:hypothetical protein
VAFKYSTRTDATARIADGELRPGEPGKPSQQRRLGTDTGAWDRGVAFHLIVAFRNDTNRQVGVADCRNVCTVVRQFGGRCYSDSPNSMQPNVP